MKYVECAREFLPKQRLILETKHRFPFYSGAFGAGKTLLGCHKVIKECLENPGSNWLCASQTYPQVRDTVLKTFLEDEICIPAEIRWNGRGDDGRRLPVGIYILYGSVDGETAVETKKTIVIAR